MKEYQETLAGPGKDFLYECGGCRFERRRGFTLCSGPVCISLEPDDLRTWGYRLHILCRIF